jgi:hypothetical protein
MTLQLGAGVIDDLTGVLVAGTVDGDLSTEPAPATANRSSSGLDTADWRLSRVKIIEMVGGRKTELDGDYYFEQPPAPNDQIVMRNRRGWYDIMRVSHTAHEGQMSVYVRRVARR